MNTDSLREKGATLKGLVTDVNGEYEQLGNTILLKINAISNRHGLDRVFLCRCVNAEDEAKGVYVSDCEEVRANPVKALEGTDIFTDA